MTPEQHLQRAREGLQEARLLLDNGYYRGACNRAYYAVFEAAHAALATQAIPVPKTHSGLNTQFHQFIVKAGLTDAALGQLLSKIERARLVADYTNKPIDAAMGNEIFEMADQFVSGINSDLTRMMAKAGG